MKLSEMGGQLSIKAMGAICMTYSLDENRYWKFIINNAIKLGMVSFNYICNTFGPSFSRALIDSTKGALTISFFVTMNQ